jgi:hypothetical protein
MKDGPITLNRAIKCYTPPRSRNKKASEDFLKKWNFHYEDAWNLDYEIAYFILVRLVLFKENKHGVPGRLGEGDFRALERKWDTILDKMIRAFYFYIAIDDYDRTPRMTKVIEKGFKLFSDYYYSLWD